ncbi:MAG TPA: response regulator transcription factor [Propionibacterium sp.]|nr:response regulator transcription factor [Propionibacterium sp.]
MKFICPRSGASRHRNYLSVAQSKLGASTRHEAVRIAQTRGWI